MKPVLDINELYHNRCGLKYGWMNVLEKEYETLIDIKRVQSIRKIVAQEKKIIRFLCCDYNTSSHSEGGPFSGVPEISDHENIDNFVEVGQEYNPCKTEDDIYREIMAAFPEDIRIQIQTSKKFDKRSITLCNLYESVRDCLICSDEENIRDQMYELWPIKNHRLLHLRYGLMIPIAELDDIKPAYNASLRMGSNIYLVNELFNRFIPHSSASTDLHIQTQNEIDYQEKLLEYGEFITDMGATIFALSRMAPSINFAGYYWDIVIPELHFIFDAALVCISHAEKNINGSSDKMSVPVLEIYFDDWDTERQKKTWLWENEVKSRIKEILNSKDNLQLRLDGLIKYLKEPNREEARYAINELHAKEFLCNPKNDMLIMEFLSVIKKFAKPAMHTVQDNFKYEKLEETKRQILTQAYEYENTIELWQQRIEEGLIDRLPFLNDLVYDAHEQIGSKIAPRLEKLGNKCFFAFLVGPGNSYIFPSPKKDQSHEKFSLLSNVIEELKNITGDGRTVPERFRDLWLEKFENKGALSYTSETNQPQIIRNCWEDIRLLSYNSSKQIDLLEQAMMRASPASTFLEERKRTFDPRSFKHLIQIPLLCGRDSYGGKPVVSLVFFSQRDIRPRTKCHLFELSFELQFPFAHGLSSENEHFSWLIRETESEASRWAHVINARFDLLVGLARAAVDRFGSDMGIDLINHIARLEKTCRYICTEKTFKSISDQINNLRRIVANASVSNFELLRDELEQMRLYNYGLQEIGALSNAIVKQDYNDSEQRNEVWIFVGKCFMPAIQHAICRMLLSEEFVYQGARKMIVKKEFLDKNGRIDNSHYDNMIFRQSPYQGAPKSILKIMDIKELRHFISHYFIKDLFQIPMEFDDKIKSFYFPSKKYSDIYLAAIEELLYNAFKAIGRDVNEAITRKTIDKYRINLQLQKQGMGKLILSVTNTIVDSNEAPFSTNEYIRNKGTGRQGIKIVYDNIITKIFPSYKWEEFVCINKGEPDEIVFRLPIKVKL